MFGVRQIGRRASETTRGLLNRQPKVYSTPVYWKVFVEDEMAHTIKDKKALLIRARRIKGQAEALERALDQEVECNAILQQITAIRGAINGLMLEVLEGHMRDHLGPHVKNTNQREEDLEQVLRVMRSYMK